MAITRIKNSTIGNRTPKYNDVLAGLPFRPIIGTATDGGNGSTVSVAFTGNNPAGAGITYTALSSPGNLTATGPTSPITVSGLTAGTAYTFQVKAGNSLGDSAYSASSNSVTPVQPTAFESIATATGTGSSGTITFSSIPGTYQHLQLRWLGRTDAAASNRQFRLEINGDTSTSNYITHILFGEGTSASATSYSGTGYMRFNVDVTAASLASGIFGAGIVDIHDYANTSKNKTVKAFQGYDANGSGYVTLESGLWLSTSAITQLTITASSGNFISSSTFALYGIRGA